MAILFGLIAALAFGTGDFIAGVASKRVPPVLVTAVVEVMGVIAAVVAVLLFPGIGPRAGALLWGAAAGIGSAGGTLALYHGMARGRMGVVATLSGLMTAVIPVLVSLALGEGLSPVSAVGIAIGVPAIGLVSWTREESAEGVASGTAWGLLAGVGFALLFVALDQAGTRSGAWPLVSGQLVALLVVAPMALVALRGADLSTPTPTQMFAAGIFSGLAVVSFFAATDEGALAIVAILTALYPGVTVILARVVLGERWSGLQSAGLLAAFLAAVLVSAGAV
jgi:drug/metabolite transporter (DMT)-like permease